MKKFAKKGILQKIIIITVTILLFNFITPSISNAAESALASLGGIIYNAVTDFIAVIGDSVLGLVQYFMIGDTASATSAKEGMMGLLNSKVVVDVGNMPDDIRASGEVTYNVSSTDIVLGRESSTDTYKVPVMRYTPEEIFKGEAPFLKVNFISPEGYINSNGDEVETVTQSLHGTIAKWYVSLRNLAVVGLLSVLVYVGIRILMSSTAADKAKYKQMFTDWLVALCLVFFLHYIMSFVLTMTESITGALGNKEGGSIIIAVDGNDAFKTNVMGAARFFTQSNDNVSRFSYLVIYLILIGYTMLFTLTYLKRTLMMAFLTIIAPLVALTYPIDKMNDGQAQAFNKWLKEFIFNALLQPFHLIIYYVFVMSAIDLAKNPIYVIAVMTFILPAEKILRNIFGFDKAGAGTLGALTGVAMASSLLKRGAPKGRIGAGKKGSGATSGGDGTSGENEKPPRFVNSREIDQIANETGGAGNPGGGQSGAGGAGNPGGGQSGAGGAGNPGGGQSGTGGAGNTNGKKKKSIIRGIKAVGRKQFSRRPGTGRRILRGIAGGIGTGAKTAVRAGIRTAGAVGLGAVGAAGGIIAGAMTGQGLAGVLAGAGAGAKMGAGLGDRLGSGVADIGGKVVNKIGTAANEGRKEFLQGYRGEKIDTSKKDVKDFMDNKDNWEYYRQKTKKADGTFASGKEVREEMKKAEEYVKKGFKNPEEIQKVQRAENFGVTPQESARAAALAKKYDITRDRLNDKNVGDTTEALKQDIMKANSAITEQEAAKKAARQVEIWKAQQGMAAFQQARTTNTNTNGRGTRNQSKQKNRKNGRK